MFSNLYKPVLKGKQYAKIVAISDQANICVTHLMPGSAFADVRKNLDSLGRQVTWWLAEQQKARRSYISCPRDIQGLRVSLTQGAPRSQGASRASLDSILASPWQRHSPNTSRCRSLLTMFYINTHTYKHICAKPNWHHIRVDMRDLFTYVNIYANMDSIRTFTLVRA